MREKVSIRNLEAILETLINAGKVSKDVYTLVDAVRQRLGPAICQALAVDAATMSVITLHPEVERVLAEAVGDGGQGQELGLHPGFAEKLVCQLSAHVQAMMQQRLPPVLLCAPLLRRHLRALTSRTIPNLGVIAHDRSAGAPEPEVIRGGGEAGLTEVKKVSLQLFAKHSLKSRDSLSDGGHGCPSSFALFNQSRIDQ